MFVKVGMMDRFFFPYVAIVADDGDRKNLQ
jgi:hypothetical protein